MKKNGKKNLLFGVILLATFVIWTALIQIVDVQPLGQNGTNIGFATFNCWFHRLTGVHMTLYTITATACSQPNAASPRCPNTTTPGPLYVERQLEALAEQ